VRLHDHGLDVLGDVARPTSRAASTEDTVIGALAPASPDVLDAQKLALMQNGILILLGSGLVAGGLTAALWKGHRVIGFLLGGVFGGFFLGSAALALYAVHVKKAEADSKAEAATRAKASPTLADLVKAADARAKGGA
jgi:hypothetical protein